MDFKLIPLWQKLVVGLAILTLVLGLSYCQGRSDGKAQMKAQIAEANAKAAEKNRVAQEKAAEQRVMDELANAKTTEERNEIIAAAPGGVVSPADRALACDRLVRSGYKAAELPVECRPGGGNGTQAPTVAGDRH